MSTDRARQKRAEKHKKKRELARREKASEALPTAPGALLRLAAARPFGPAWVASDVHDVDAPMPPIVQVVMTRRLPGGVLLPAMALVDRTCLGVKNGFLMRPVGEAELDVIVARVGEEQPLEPCDALFAQSVVFHAIDYARALGFAPHRDFPAALFGPRPAALLDTPLCRRARPYFVSGPADDVEAIVLRLEAALGADGFDFGIGRMDGLPLLEQGDDPELDALLDEDLDPADEVGEDEAEGAPG